MGKKFFTKQVFSTVESIFRNNYALGIETLDVKGREDPIACSGDCHPEFCKIVRSSPTGLKRCMQDRLRSMTIAFETGQPYISICHAGIVLICIPAMDHDMPLGGVFFGKCLWEKPEESLKDDINKRLKGIRIDRAKLGKAIDKLPILSGRKVHEAAEFLFVTVYEMTAFDPHVIQKRRERATQQSQISDLIQERKRIPFAGQYPIEAEKQLINKVKIGDRLGAKEILNMILASIMLRDPGDLGVLKVRMLELISVLSRSAAEGGVDINFLLEKNLDYINKVITIENQQDMCAWIGNAMNDFVEMVYSTQDSKRVTQIKPAIDYIESHYSEPLMLCDVAKAAHLSVSRLSHVFKEQVGITIVDYLTNIRMEHAKELLISTDHNCTQVCFETGYNNQSYFTRTFKEIVGLTPRQFRELNRRQK